MQRENASAGEWLTIGEVAAMAGLQASTLRYYESIGLLPPAKRVSGQRRYTTNILSVLAVIQMAKEASFSLPEIQALLHSRTDGEVLSQRWQSLALGICRTARSRYAASTLITGWASDRADRHTPG